MLYEPISISGILSPLISPTPLIVRPVLLPTIVPVNEIPSFDKSPKAKLDAHSFSNAEERHKNLKINSE